MDLMDMSAPGDTFNIMFEVDYVDQQCCCVTSVSSRPITVLYHEFYTRLCFIDVLTGDVINAWYAGTNGIAVENIMFDYYEEDFEGMISPPGPRVIFPDEQGLRYTKHPLGYNTIALELKEVGSLCR
jgi:hypothetical protein